MRKKARRKFSGKRTALSLQHQEFLKLILLLILDVLLIPLISGFLIGLLIVLVYFGGFFPWASHSVSVTTVFLALALVLYAQRRFSDRLE